MAAAAAAENELNILPYVYEVMKSIEKDTSDVRHTMTELRTQFQRARECVDRLPGTQHSPEEQLRLRAVLHQQLLIKTRLLNTYRSGQHFHAEQSHNCVKRKVDVTMSEMHPIFTKDPQEWLSLVHRLVQVTTEDGRQHSGYVYTVDPVSESIVLLNPSCHDGKEFSSPSLTLLPGASIVGGANVLPDGLDEESVQRQFDSLFRPPSTGRALSAAELDKRKLQLKHWLEQHRLPVELASDGKSLVLAGAALTVLPPYTKDSCLSTNEIILARIRSLIHDMPDEQDVDA